MRQAIGILASLAVVFAVVEWRLAGPDPLPSSAPATSFSAERAFAAIHSTIGGDIAHPVGTAEHDAVRDRIVAHLRSLGYETSVENRFACNAHVVCAPTSNILAVAPGASNTSQAVYLVAHYDSVGAGPGAADDGAGVATLLEIARAIRDNQLRNPVVFLIDDAEETGLLGAEAFVEPQRRGAPPAGAIVNLEARGTSGPSYLFETSRNNERLVSTVAHALPRPMTSSLFATIYDMLPNDTDLTVFKRNGYSGVNFAFLRDVTFYHTPLDDSRHLSLRTLQHHGENVLAATRALGNASLPMRSNGNAIWFDVLGFFVVSWPAAWTLVIALAVLIIAIAALVALQRNGQSSLASAAIAAGAALVVSIAALAIGFLATLAYARTGAQWVAHPLPQLASAWLIGVLVVFAASTLLARRVAPPAWLGGAAVYVALLGVITAVALPGASYLFIAPAAVLALCGLLRATGAIDIALAAGIGAIATAVMFFPLAIQIYWALGTVALPAVALVIAFVALPAAAAMRFRWRALAVAAIALVATIVAGALTPAVTPERPSRNSLVYLDDGASARWLAGDPTQKLRSIASFRKETVAVFPWRGSGANAAPAERLNLSPVTATRTTSADVHTFQITSHRSAHCVALFFKSSGPVAILDVNGTTPPPKPARFHAAVQPPWHEVVAYGQDVVVHVRVPAGISEAYALDYSYGLPPTGASLALARSASNQVASHDGDLTITMRRVQ